MWMLRVSLTCLALGLMALLFVPFALAKALAGVLGLLFVVFLVLGLATVDNFATTARTKRCEGGLRVYGRLRRDERLLQDQEQLGDVHRLREHLPHPRGPDAAQILVGRDAREREDRRRVDGPLVAPGEPGRPVAVGERDVEDDRVDRVAGENRFGLLQVGRGFRGVALRLEQSGETVAGRLVVFHDEDRAPTRAAGFGRRRSAGRAEALGAPESRSGMRQLGNGERHGRSDALAALEDEVASHDFGELLRDRQPEAGSAGRLARARTDLLERLERFGDQIRRDAGAGIAHLEGDRALPRPGRDRRRGRSSCT